MGAVYKVQHMQLKQAMALKIMPQDGYVEEKMLRRFDQEAKAASRLHHPNLVGVHDYGVTGEGAPFLVMDFFEGKSPEGSRWQPTLYESRTMHKEKTG